ncbi:short-chain dehydrogenase [Cryobacterium sp. LW097]|uniref:SDR family NAD(P)-dependent oxidoreductase n=1 Tax=unclassified Cryobacterium TaxID=2649013 RepID=UPI000B4C590C|nr:MULTISPECIES: SDR family NAD(P)-dependent oxidoreductase [unclassified Cryobacterium]ASD21593.1 short-chain dehydrogenase [Cryobacterium sp. LW097]TFC54989.1 SDR family NAD(P)-dependent oxidoreductase [Cryobacterium sp. TMB3-1-2]TFC70331.1 SDR family NAD(P)-dependent oxidoreductase [Cryobacterium sp. TMB3-15]TFC75672.1 SDR family NAD(P)-dependent oxidoreductase [Cryobacterium sp. TMB3-10]TFC84956.1 SDR family NAD(P)-dependent oxidoreductase [Cryobacterium sp. TMT4-31]
MDPIVTPGRFAGQTAIVTGAGSGIGKATAVRLAREGARVIAGDVVPARLQELLDQFGDLDIVTVDGDISHQDTTTRLVAAANGRIDVVANVAGVMDGFLPIAEVDDATWERVFGINVTGMMRLIRGALPIMVAGGGGSIVNVTSEAGLRGGAAGVAYTSSKHAVIGLTRNTSVMYSAQGIRCNAVAPGGVQTNIEAPMRSPLAGSVLGPVFQHVLPPVATSEQLAATITWLASPDSANVTGIVLASDGGWSAI